jgi:predicted ATPase/DNA-binding SARP family transcriptional activator
MTLDFRVLGPLEVRGEAGPLPLGGRRERVVLALLLLNANRRVSSDELAAALWGESPPATAATAVQVVISRLRKLLERGAELRTDRGGYVLRIDPDQLDLHRAERLVEEGRTALAQGRSVAAASQLREALDLWRGPVLADLGYERFAQPHIARLEELRLVVLEERIEAELTLGQHASLVAELTTLVHEHPLRERLRGQLMLALYRSGRQADALAAYQETRATLVEELGLEPGTELQELNRRILNQDPELALAARSLPRGTVTFLAADVEGSTRLLRRLGERYPEVLAETRRLLREALAAGLEVDAKGDSVLYAFERATEAVEAAAAATRALVESAWPGGAQVAVRIGVHTGEPTVAQDDYVGLDVHRVARICDAAHGGQVVLSRETRELLDELADGLSLRDLGPHELKDLPEPERLFQLVISGVRQEFPPLRALHASNVPIPATSFVGREQELTELGDLLLGPDVRLVTLRGPGGSGKTRLALEAARVLRSSFRDGVAFVPLAPVHHPGYVLHHVAQGIGLLETLSEPLAEPLARSLRDRELLLLVDNFDHVLAAAPQLSFLIERTESLKVLVTSRVALRLGAEHVVEVPPLALPEPGLRDPETLARSEAVALFSDRARAVARGFRLTEENAREVAEICRRLDGLPLALELAAARANVLSAQAMLARMDRRLGLLTGGARDLPERQRTLRATIDWSHELLDERNQLLFRRLAVFVGGCTVEAVASVCGLGEDDVLDGLAALVDNSLLSRQEEPGQPEPRFALLETVGEYASERLVESGEAEAFRSRHADYFIDVAEVGYARRLDDELAWSARFETEIDNLRAALWFLRSVDGARYLRLAGALAWFWSAHSHIREGREWFAYAAIDKAGERDARLARALAGDGVLACEQGDFASSFERLTASVALWHELGDELERAMTLEELAHAHFVAGEMEASAARAEESMTAHRAHGQPKLAVRAQLVLAHALVAQGDVERAEALAEEGLAFALATGDPRSAYRAHHVLGDCAMVRRDCELAQRRFLDSLRLAWDRGDRFHACDELDGFAVALAACGDPRRGLRLAAAALAHLDVFRIEPDKVAFWTELRDGHLTLARSELGQEAEAVWEEGRALTLERAIEEALALPVVSRAPVESELGSA